MKWKIGRFHLSVTIYTHTPPPTHPHTQGNNFQIVLEKNENHCESLGVGVDRGECHSHVNWRVQSGKKMVPEMTSLLKDGLK